MVRRAAPVVGASFSNRIDAHNGALIANMPPALPRLAKQVSSWLMICALAGACGSSEMSPPRPSTAGVPEYVPTPHAAEPAPEPETARRLRRLTNTEIEEVVTDLLEGRRLDLGSGFLPDPRVEGYDNDALALGMSESKVEELVMMSERVAVHLTEGAALGRHAPCPAGEDEAACARRFATRTATRAWGRPPSEMELQRLDGVYQVGRDGEGYTGGIALLAQAVLQSPHFIYRSELGAAPSAADVARGWVELTGLEIASVMSFLLRGSRPDAPLLEAALAGSLATPEVREQQARRLLASPEGRRRISHFLRAWLGLENVAMINKDVAILPLFTPRARRALDRELTLFFDHVLAKAEARLDELLLADYTFPSPELAPFYNTDLVGEPPGDFQMRQLDAGRRRGVLSSPAFLAAHALIDQTNPIERGLVVRGRLFCQDVAPPPPSVAAPAARRRTGDHHPPALRGPRQGPVLPGLPPAHGPAGLRLRAVRCCRPLPHRGGRPADRLARRGGDDRRGRPLHRAGRAGPAPAGQRPVPALLRRAAVPVRRGPHVSRAPTAARSTTWPASSSRPSTGSTSCSSGWCGGRCSCCAESSGRDAVNAVKKSAGMSRRELLRATGAAGALFPFLRPRAASAAPATPRLVLLMQSNGTHQPAFWPKLPDGVTLTAPAPLGAGGLTSPILQPLLGDPALAARVTLIKGINNTSGGSGNGHDQGFTGLYSGYKSIGPFLDPWGAGISIDQHLKRALTFSELFPTLNCGVLASDTPPFKAHRRSFSYLAARRQVPTEVDPYRLYTRFFGVGAKPEPGQDPVALAKHRLRRKETVLDFARQDLNSLRPGLGKLDREKLDAHRPPCARWRTGWAPPCCRIPTARPTARPSSRRGRRSSRPTRWRRCKA